MSQSQEDLMDNINDIMEEFDTAMLVSKDENGILNARPMNVARHLEDTGVLYFTTSAHTGKIEEIGHNPQVNVTMQSSKQYVTLSGEAMVLNDRALIAEMFTDAWKAWYPEGPEQEDIRLIRFSPDQGEYWNMSGLKGLKFLWEAGKSIAQGEKMEIDDLDTNAKVDM